MAATACDTVHTVSDADFGYWNSEKWGEPSVQEFPCTNTAAVTIEWDGETIHLCTECAEYYQ